MVEGQLKELNKRVVLQELSAELEKERSPERAAKPKAMETKVEKLQAVFKKGDMVGIASGYSSLKYQLGEYLRSLEADEEGDQETSDPSGTWREAALRLTKDYFGEGKSLPEDSGR
jgi:hypothetical protein